jgi:hypothetical protein
MEDKPMNSTTDENRPWHFAVWRFLTDPTVPTTPHVLTRLMTNQAEPTDVRHTDDLSWLCEFQAAHIIYITQVISSLEIPNKPFSLPKDRGIYLAELVAYMNFERILGKGLVRGTDEVNPNKWNETHARNITKNADGVVDTQTLTRHDFHDGQHMSRDGDWRPFWGNGEKRPPLKVLRPSTSEDELKTELLTALRALCPSGWRCT